MTPARLKAYVKAQFRQQFPKADQIYVSYIADDESWEVSVDDVFWHMTIGSDDDEFSFHCDTVPHTRIRFPLPPERR